MKFMIIFALIAGIANATPKGYPHGFTRTVVNGPSGSIVQETPGAPLPIYAPAFSARVALQEPIVAAPAVAAEPTALYGSPAVAVPAPVRALPYAPAFRHVVAEPLVSAPVLAQRAFGYAPSFARAIPEPVVAAPAFHASARAGFILPGQFPAYPALSGPAPVFETRALAAPLPIPAPIAPTFVESRVVLPAPSPVFETRAIAAPLPIPAPIAPTFVESRVALPAPTPVFETRALPAPVFPAPAPVFAERFLAPRYAVAAPAHLFDSAPVALPEPGFAARAYPTPAVQYAL